MSQRPVRLLVTGFAIGTADLVPGVSGGTVALISGIYPSLVGSIAAGAGALGRLLSGHPGEARQRATDIDWRFLVPVVVGAIAAVAVLSQVVEDLLRDEPVRAAAGFFGLIVGAIWVAWRMISHPRLLHVSVAGTLGLAMFLLYGFSTPAPASPGWPIFLVSGALAICAFILPGVSGSFLLVAIGMYQPVLAAVTDLQMVSLSTFALGAATGLALFSRLLQRLLERHHDMVVAAMIGLMIGSLRVLWPWPDGLGTEASPTSPRLGAPGPDLLIPVTIALVAALVVVSVDGVARRRTW